MKLEKLYEKTTQQPQDVHLKNVFLEEVAFLKKMFCETGKYFKEMFTVFFEESLEYIIPLSLFGEVIDPKPHLITNQMWFGVNNFTKKTTIKII